MRARFGAVALALVFVCTGCGGGGHAERRAVSRYIDDVNFHVGKDFRDTVRHLQRELRDNFATRAEEVQRSSAAALQAVQQSAQQDQAQRQQRLQVVEGELKKLGTAKQKLQQMMSGK